MHIRKLSKYRRFSFSYTEEYKERDYLPLLIYRQTNTYEYQCILPILDLHHFMYQDIQLSVPPAVSEGISPQNPRENNHYHHHNNNNSNNNTSEGDLQVHFRRSVIKLVSHLSGHTSHRPTGKKPI